ncbi:hypothetical protein [Streptomyces sp. DH37]|uniref:hypothetical protein n=1 Tax=Streptomyces sp. DH37 TaxID=3040122 RepID=UPI002442B994|nr:hypothetical protein [Streptomyces sp. DH37]MDG9701999.1 hypothetical protein [Streptomyces sp. DH37]
MSAVTGEAMRTSDGRDGWRRHEERLAEINVRIVALIRQFTEQECLLADARKAAGLSRTDLSRENEMVRYYAEELDGHGADLALLLLVMRRGRS